ncbi:putative GMC-type oxidoreductase [Kordia antarctica]|uniref:Putative GMC-type oxidoreductase n=1 Tax=Kordia antarctica TaxID=1218801 RepID=A0A7L4ZHK2_9FLAO|nr:GMC family oxidoreductase N-terminal domain-containing protein [Kordia antarctica]QHI36102.1 putative GMC-type oxidoreductase [Kordia antarctica]
MTELNQNNQYDAIIIGSGTCGATIAKELAKQKKKVLILERGKTVLLKESLSGIVSIMNEISVGKKLKDMRALTTGGTTALYFGVAALPPFDTFSSLGIDLTQDYEEAKKELPINYLPDEIYGNQSLKLRDSALELGYSWEKQLMLVDLSKCKSGYSYESKWKAKSFVDDAIDDGATLVNRAEVTKIIFDKNKAIGVEYKFKVRAVGSTLYQAFGEKIILAAGIHASPMILRNSGIKNVAKNGFYFDPNMGIFGLIPGLKSTDNFVGTMQTHLEDDISLGDANVQKLFYKILTVAMFKPRHYFSFSDNIGIGVKVEEPMGGELMENGKYHKTLSQEVLSKLDRGTEAAIEILKNAGAKHIIKSPLSPTSVGGALNISEHVDKNLETEFKNLYVCDRSVLPDTYRKPPTLTLVCLAKYLARHLLAEN